MSSTGLRSCRAMRVRTSTASQFVGDVVLGEEVRNEAAQDGSMLGLGDAAQREAAVDADALAGQERGVVAEQERDDQRDVVGIAEPAERRLSLERGARGCIIGQRCGGVGADESGEYRVHAN